MTTPARTLDTRVRAFVDVLAPLLSDLAVRTGSDAAHAEADVLADAANIVAGVFSADHRVTDAELVAMATLFGALEDPRVASHSPPDRRRLLLVQDGTRYLETPSTLLSLLLDADAMDRRTPPSSDGPGGGARRAIAYRACALQLAYAAVAIDGYAGRLELRAVEAFRAMLDRLVPEALHPAADDLNLFDGGRHGPGTRNGRDAWPVEDRPGDAREAGGAARPVAVVDGVPPPERSLDDCMTELNGLIGLKPVKEQVRQVADLLTVERLRTEHGLPVAPQSLHLVFTGNPGTGKTTVARLLAQIYRALGALDKGHLVETDRSGLVAGFVGQTASRVTEAVEAADGGLLLIDEAYALSSGGPTDFGREAIDTLVKHMEDRRSSLAVIVAGYPELMSAFIASNPGLRSRFPRTIHFPDYDTGELVRIVDLLAEKHHYRLTQGAKRRIREHLDAVPRGPGFGNGRLARNLFEAAVARQATRVVRMSNIDSDDLMRITAADVRQRDAA